MFDSSLQKGTLSSSVRVSNVDSAGTSVRQSLRVCHSSTCEMRVSVHSVADSAAPTPRAPSSSLSLSTQSSTPAARRCPSLRPPSAPSARAALLAPWPGPSGPAELLCLRGALPPLCIHIYMYIYM